MKRKNTHSEPIKGNILSDSLRVTPFSTPENFFISQQRSIETQLAIEKYNLRADSTAYTVPDFYFNQLEEQVLLKISESKLKDQVDMLDYQVPKGYFETLEHSIQSRIIEDKLKDTVSETGFNVPTGYFSDQKDNLQIKIAEYNLKSKVAEEGFVVPENYFASLTDTIKKAAKQVNDDKSEEATIISFSERKKWFSYVSTAAVVFIIGIGSYFAVQKESTEPTSPETSLQASNTNVNLRDVSNEEIVNYLAQVYEGEDLIQLTKFINEETSSQRKIDKRIDDEDIKDYLNYML